MMMIRTLLTTATLALYASAPLTASAQTVDAAFGETPELYVVMFRADWCPPCKIVEPAIATALNDLRDPSIEYVEIDISDPGLSEIGAHRAFDREIVSQYNKWLGVTGFAAIVDATNKRTLGCVNRLYDAGSMATHIRNLKTFAVNDAASFDLTCPEANNPVG
jgi:thiol-disulfide isomerase/thioredoxin